MRRNFAVKTGKMRRNFVVKTGKIQRNFVVKIGKMQRNPGVARRYGLPLTSWSNSSGGRWRSSFSSPPARSLSAISRLRVSMV